ncbi:MAG TPA: hypothetical protein VFX61_02185, partial [Micromonosporaceae bacterium]|nr:hypothetical protein [Micromonosporaceae bacterium]
MRIAVIMAVAVLTQPLVLLGDRWPRVHARAIGAAMGTMTSAPAIASRTKSRRRPRSAALVGYSELGQRQGLLT